MKPWIPITIFIIALPAHYLWSINLLNAGGVA